MVVLLVSFTKNPQSTSIKGREGKGRKGRQLTNHVPAIASTQRHSPVTIDLGQVRHDPVKAALEVLVGAAAPVAADGVLEGHTVTRAARRVGAHDHVALLGEHGRVPARRPGVLPGALRPTVHEHAERVFLLLLAAFFSAVILR